MNHALPVISIPSPCSEDWSGMAGSTTARTCASCDHTVHRLDRLSPPEQRSLLTRAGRERICVAVLAGSMTVLAGTGCSDDAPEPQPLPQILVEPVDPVDPPMLLGRMHVPQEPPAEPPLMVMGAIAPVLPAELLDDAETAETADTDTTD